MRPLLRSVVFIKILHKEFRFCFRHFLFNDFWTDFNSYVELTAEQHFAIADTMRPLRDIELGHFVWKPFYRFIRYRWPQRIFSCEVVTIMFGYFLWITVQLYDSLSLFQFSNVEKQWDILTLNSYLCQSVWPLTPTEIKYFSNHITNNNARRKCLWQLEQCRPNPFSIQCLAKHWSCDHYNAIVECYV